MLPHVANAFSQGDMNKVNKMLYKSFDFVSAMAYPMMFGLAAISLTLAPKYYGSGYGPVGQAMFIESVVILMIGWSNVLGVQYLLPIHKQKEFTISVTLGAIVNVILNVPLIEMWGLNGAMIATSIAEFSVTLYQLFIVKRSLSLKDLFHGSWKYFISGLIMFIVVFWMNRNLKDSWLMLFLEIIVGIIIYAMFTLILRVPIIYEVRDLIIKRLRK